jgi:3-phosphoshikimate 1-carboxyvinyltransferase
MIFQLEKETKELKGTIRLDGSKSISNRALMIRALCGDAFPIDNLSTSQDTSTLADLLSAKRKTYDAGPAGTTFRFLTAYLAIQEGKQVLTGSKRMKERPIGPLVDALRDIGAKITYLEKDGFPPLEIDTPQLSDHKQVIEIPATISSQFISALAMIGPALPGGLEINLKGDIVSLSYLEMTMSMMRHFGADINSSGHRIIINPGKYQALAYDVEADWSAASYYYAIAAMAETVDFKLRGLFRKSMQGDTIIFALFKKLGIQSTWQEDGLHLTKKSDIKPLLELDFILCPDIAQTVAVVCGGMGIAGVFSGLETLRIKETDRIVALQNELGKIGVYFSAQPERFSDKKGKQFFTIEGKGKWKEPPLFETYHDHRMAMAFAPLSIIRPVCIVAPDVVKKSYPGFWKDLVSLGWKIRVFDSKQAETWINSLS